MKGSSRQYIVDNVVIETTDGFWAFSEEAFDCYESSIEDDIEAAFNDFFKLLNF